MLRKWFRAILIAGGLVAVLAPLSSSSAKPTETARYSGRITFAPKSRVEINVRMRDDRPKSAVIEVQNAPLVCFDPATGSTFPNRDLPPITARFASRSTFSATRYERSPNGDWTLYEIRGTLSGRHADGFVYYVEDPFDAPSGRAGAECNPGASTDLNWRARLRK